MYMVTHEAVQKAQTTVTTRRYICYAAISAPWQLLGSQNSVRNLLLLGCTCCCFCCCCFDGCCVAAARVVPTVSQLLRRCTCHAFATETSLWEAHAPARHAWQGVCGQRNKVERPRAESHQRTLLTARSSSPLSEPSLKELHTRRAPSGLGRKRNTSTFQPSKRRWPHETYLILQSTIVRKAVAGLASSPH